ncbi:MAG: NifU family protein, partial [Blastocatellia bacterium]|nr:NifU family protein [Blastocatellia bacterium]
AVQTAGGDIELLSLVEGIVKVRLAGDFHGSLTTAKAIKNLVEETILQAAPDVTGVDVIGGFGLPEGSGLVQLGRAVSRNGNISN